MRLLPSGKKDHFYYTAWKLVDVKKDANDYRRHQVILNFKLRFQNKRCILGGYCDQESLYQILKNTEALATSVIEDVNALMCIR